MKKIHKPVSVLLSIVMILSMLTIVPFGAGAAEKTPDVSLEEGTYVQNQVVVLFKDSAIDFETKPKKAALEPIGADFGEMMEASSSAGEALSAADEEVDILSKSLGDDFVLEDTLVFDEPKDETGKAGGAVGASGHTFEGLTIALVSSEKYSTAELIEKLSGNRNVAKVEPNYIIHHTALDDYSLNDIYNSYLYHVNSPAAKNTDGESVDDRGTDPETALSINAASGWKKLTGDEDEIVVAVIDSGVLDTHEDLKDVMWDNNCTELKGKHGYNFADNNTKSFQDESGHGTHCAGVIAAQANNLKGVAGIASAAEVKIMALKTISGIFGTSTAYAAYGAFDYIHKAVQYGVNVVAVNNSWGGNLYSDIYDEVINLIGEDGVVSYIASGNSGENCDRVMFDPSNTDSEFAINIGAADIAGKPTAFTNYGKTSVDIFGAGMNILSTVAYKSYYPDIYTADKFNYTTEYYGEFNADTVVTDGRITPSKGSKAGDLVKSFGEIKFVRQKLDEENETELTDNAKLELSVEQGKHFVSGNPYRLKLTVKDAQPNEEYFIYFPYEKNPLCSGDSNTLFSFSAESVSCPTGAEAAFYCGEVSADDSGRYALTGRQSSSIPGGVKLCSTSKSNDGIQRHSTNNVEDSAKAYSNNTAMLLSAEQAGDKEVGLGLYVASTWSEGSHDLSLYLDSLAISEPNADVSKESSYDVMSGTSMACPAVCGGGALISALNPRQEGESGADYAKRIRAKVLSCVTRTDELRELCSTGGYLDLSKLDASVPSISDAVCDVDKETITLIGENLFEGCTVTYRSLCAQDSQATSLPENMKVESSADGKQLAIRNAKSLFSTYTEFTVTSADGVSGSGKFFLVKGQPKLTSVSSELKDTKTYYEMNGSDLSRVQYELLPPSLLTDRNGENLYGYNGKTGEIYKFDGKQFVTIKDSALSDSLCNYLVQQGESRYTVYNGYQIYFVNTDVPANENGVVYIMVQINPPDDDDSDESGEDWEDGEGNFDDPDDDGGFNYRALNDEDDNEDGEDEPEPVYVDDSWYLCSFDLNSDDPHWSVSEIEAMPSDIEYTEYSESLSVCVCGGKLYYLSKSMTPSENESNALLMYSLDLKTKKWSEEPGLPSNTVGFDFVSSGGKLYAMFGYLPDTSLSTDERLSGSIYCFDGEKWEKKEDKNLIGRVYNDHGNITCREAVTSVKNGMVFVGASADGGGNVFLYNTSTDRIEPLYYTTSDSLSDNYGEGSSCVATRDGIYYIRHIRDDYKSGWALSLLPESSGVYESPFVGTLLGDANGDGKVTIDDATMIQKYVAHYEMPSSFVLEACDTNGDGKVSIDDVTDIQRFIAGLEASEGIGEPIAEDALSLWTNTAPLKSELTKYMKAITDKNSKDYIPVENRIAVFDMDGTLCCETDPGYFDHKLFYHRVMEDPDYKDKASDYEKEVCADIKTYFDTGVYPKGMDVRHGTAVATAFKGMTPAQFDAYVKAYRDTPMNSYTNMTNGQAFYKPMLQVVDFLQANDFKVYIVSGTDRLITRGLAEGMINIPLAQMIGSDESLVATGQGGADGLDYTFTQDDELVTGGEFIIKNLKMNKVSVIEQEIGLQPVLCFGNSSGDAAMANYTITNNKYRSGAFLLCCDDLERENGNLAKADSMRASCEKNGWTAVSMKNDWTTIYGDGVTKK